MATMTRMISIPLAAALALTACNNDSSSPTGPSEARSTAMRSPRT